MWVVILILILTLPWKGSALWISARRGHVGWFLVLLVLNTMAILDILYIFVFSKWGGEKRELEEKQEQTEPEEVVRKPRFSHNSKSQTNIV